MDDESGSVIEDMHTHIYTYMYVYMVGGWVREKKKIAKTSRFTKSADSEKSDLEVAVFLRKSLFASWLQFFYFINAFDMSLRKTSLFNHI